ncbi:MAG TPA: TIR domain-containing protein [Bryobacteraceae bacterium]
MRILIVEDDHFYAQVIAELLQDRGIMVTLAGSGQDALGTDIETYDGAIIDVMLPNDPELSGITNEESRGGFLTGVCVARQLLKRSEKLRIVLLTSAVTGNEAEAWAGQHSVAFLSKDEGSGALLRKLGQMGLSGTDRAPRVFIVHGHDEVALMQVKDYVQNTLKWQEPIVLREQPNAGKTIIEKFEELASEVDWVFVVLTPDDIAIAAGTNDEKRRSRQNVIFEMGYFCGSLGRRSGRVVLLHKGPIELPSDISGVVWIDITNGVKGAGEEIRKEVTALKKP